MITQTPTVVKFFALKCLKCIAKNQNLISIQRFGTDIWIEMSKMHSKEPKFATFTFVPFCGTIYVKMAVLSFQRKKEERKNEAL